MSYADPKAGRARFTDVLRELGVGRGDRVFTLLQRLDIGDGRVLVTASGFYRREVVPVRDRLPQLEHVLLVDVGNGLPLGTRSLAELMAGADDDFEIPPTARSGLLSPNFPDLALRWQAAPRRLGSLFLSM